jgi:hypothetical protein
LPGSESELAFVDPLRFPIIKVRIAHDVALWIAISRNGVRRRALSGGS